MGGPGLREQRLQLSVDDPAVVAWGTQAQVDETLDLAVIWWLILGLDLAWPKGYYGPPGHLWIGIGHTLRGEAAVMTLPEAYSVATLEAIEPLA